MTTVSLVSGEPASLLGLAQSDPKRTLELGMSLIDDLPAGDHAGRSTVFRALGIAARSGADMSASLGFGEQSVHEARLARDATLRSKAFLSLAGSLAFSGDNSGALRKLDEAAEHEEPMHLADVDFQRGTILGRIGEPARALACFSSALPIFEEHDDRESIAMTLHNRAMVLLSIGDLERAEDDLGRALSIDTRDHRHFRVAGEEHGLGIVASLRGDIPLALTHFDESARGFKGLVGSASESQVSRCEVLLSGGLFREALALAGEVVRDMHRAGLAEDEAEARLVGANAALLAGDVDTALSWADRALAMFDEQNRTIWAASARLIGIQAKHHAGATDPTLIDDAHMVAETLGEAGHDLGAFRAWLLSGSIAQRLGLDEQARRDLSRVAEHRGGPIEIRLQARLATALLRSLEGDRRGVGAAVRAGLDLLDDYRAALGATDIRLGVERHARLLGDLGLRMALESGRPRRVFGWMERARSRALIYRPVAPPPDGELAAELAELRQVAAELRDAHDQKAADLMRRQRGLQERIRSRARLTRGTGVVTRRVGAPSLLDCLGNGILVEFASLDDVLWAIVIQDGRFRLREVGLESEIMTELQSLRFSMRRLTRGRDSVAVAAEAARRLDRLLFGSLSLGAGPLVIVPTADLYITPWSALLGCQGRPVTITPSAELWYRAVGKKNRGGDSVLVAGPDLEMAHAELIDVAALYPKARMVASTESAVKIVQAHLDGAAMAHIASHASFQYENPMFSSLRLSDGDLYVYDIERLESAPGLVVLSACDSGFTETHPGDELMGLSSALLSMGTRSVIASVGLVPDSDATKDLMVALHRGLVSGLSPSEALHRAQMEAAETPEGYVAASSFICIGAS